MPVVIISVAQMLIITIVTPGIDSPTHTKGRYPEVCTWGNPTDRTGASVSDKK